MRRREFLLSAAAVATPNAPRTSMGIATTSYMTVARPRDPFEFLEHCKALGAGGTQASPSSLEPKNRNRMVSHQRPEVIHK